MVAEDVDFDEVDDGAVSDAVVQVAERSAQYQGKRDRDEGYPAAEADERDQDGDGSKG